MFIPTIESCNRIKEKLLESYPNKYIECRCSPYSPYSTRKIIVSSSYKSSIFRYVYTEGYVEMQYNPDYYREEFDTLRDLYKEVRDCEFGWHAISYYKWGLCRYQYYLEDEEEVVEAFMQIINLFDPLLSKYNDDINSIYTNEDNAKYPSLAYVEKLSDKVDDTVRYTHPAITTVQQLSFDQFQIPSYQRPYKWTAKNVNQLITDIMTFADNSSYRLGTLVLHNNDIVDGQQRIITLSLLLNHLLIKYAKEDIVRENYQGMRKKLSVFLEHKFCDPYTLHNIVENQNVIETRSNELTLDYLTFILTRCEFVVIQLNDISEAFQFFDSQNARGKDLEAHDLLKAYHLREMEKLSNRDVFNIEKWERQDPATLQMLFLMLFRAKFWSLGKSALYFTKNETDVFKGISLKDKSRYPFYQLEVIAHIYVEYYMSSPDRMVDQHSIEYPYNLNDQIVNGSRFFDMIVHYLALYDKVADIQTYKEWDVAYRIIETVQNYNGNYRTGDKYVQTMFYTALIYYVDRFGYVEMDKILPKIFVWSFALRLQNYSVQMYSMNRYSIENESMFRLIHEASTPYDIINITQESIDNTSCSKCEEIKDLFVKFKKLRHS